MKTLTCPSSRAACSERRLEALRSCAAPAAELSAACITPAMLDDTTSVSRAPDPYLKMSEIDGTKVMTRSAMSSGM